MNGSDIVDLKLYRFVSRFYFASQKVSRLYQFQVVNF